MVRGLGCCGSFGAPSRSGLGARCVGADIVPAAELADDASRVAKQEGVANGLPRLNSLFSGLCRQSERS
jgi:hypothetical protein